MNVQPSDETPLPDVDHSYVLSDRETIVNQAIARVDAATAEAHAAVEDLANQATGLIVGADADAHVQLSGMIGQVDNKVRTAELAADNALTKVMRPPTDRIAMAEGDVAGAGVQFPYTIAERESELASNDPFSTLARAGLIPLGDDAVKGSPTGGGMGSTDMTLPGGGGGDAVPIIPPAWIPPPDPMPVDPGAEPLICGLYRWENIGQVWPAFDPTKPYTCCDLRKPDGSPMGVIMPVNVEPFGNWADGRDLCQFRPPVPPVPGVPPIIIPPVPGVPPVPPVPGPGGECCPPQTIIVNVPPPAPAPVPPPGKGPPAVCPTPPVVCPTPETDVKVTVPVTVNVPKNDCPVDEPPDWPGGEGDIGADSTRVQWWSPDACKQASEYKGSTLGNRVFFGSGVSGSWLSIAGDVASFLIPGFNASILRADHSGVSGQADVGKVAAEQTIGSVVADRILTQITPFGVQNADVTRAMLGRLGIAGFAQQIGGVPLDYIMSGERYTLQYHNPQYLPSQADLDGMYLTSQVSYDTWICLTRANGNIPMWSDKVLNAKVTRPNPGEIVQLYLRGELGGKDMYYLRMAGQGVKERDSADEYLKLAQQLPGPSDLVRMMVRDAADDNVALRYNFDKDFNNKFTGVIGKWAESQGLDASVFKYLWRSHWVIPSNTQLYEMFHRLRPDRQEVFDWDAYLAINGPVKTLLDKGPRPPVVTLDDVKTALEVNDQAPAWIDSLLAISYHPINPSDARRAFQIGSFDEKRLTGVLLDNGYNPADAQTVVSYEKTQKSRSIANSTGVYTARRIMQDYASGVLLRSDAQTLLSEIMPDQMTRINLLDRADAMYQADTARQLLKDIRLRYIQGQYDDVTAQNLLTNIPVPRPKSDQIIARWKVDKFGRSKDPTVRMLCTWFNHRLIGAAEYKMRLLNLGYTDGDADKILAVCNIDEVKKEVAEESKKEQKNYKELLSDLQKQFNDAQKVMKQYEKWIKDHNGGKLP